MDSTGRDGKGKSSEQPLSFRKLCWDSLKSVRRWVVSGLSVGILLSILRFSPEELAVTLGAWALFLKEWALVAIFVIFALLVIVFLYKLWREYGSLLSQVQPRVETEKYARISYEFTSLFDTRSRIMDILREFSETEELKEIKIIAATGSSIIPLFTEYVESGRPTGNLVFQVLIMDPSSGQITKAAEHWPAEAQYNSEKVFPAINERLKKMGKKVRFEWKTYDFFPCVQGLLFGEKYLFMGWMEWVKVGTKMELRGAEKPFSYFEQGNENARYFFSLFHSWFDYAWNLES